ncbi:MAG: leucyl aminopeptidase family protein [Roseiarcus sp.]
MIDPANRIAWEFRALLASFAPPSPDAVPVWFATPENWDELRKTIGGGAARFADACGFEPKAGRVQWLPDAEGGLAGVLFGLADKDAKGRDPMAPGALASALPQGTYRFANAPHEPELAALAFLLGLYRFERYHADPRPRPSLVAPEGVEATRIERIAAAVAFGRDLVNTPANDLGPAALEHEAERLAEEFGASMEVTRGSSLLERNLPLIHAVGRASAEAPRLVDFVWGRADAPKVTLVGKGVAFDSGGLDIKPSSGMLLMKKDMGGAAAALCLARLVMQSGLDVRLRVIVPIVENAISADAMRPGDVLRSRKGLTVEIGNTDAEGRLILADALALADEEAPDLMFDFATLTGAARVALGPDLPPFYTDDEALAAEIAGSAARVSDPLWRLPLWRPYDAMLESKVADLDNAPSGSFAGSVTAALFLARFVSAAKAWAHFDIYAWNPKPRAHGPQGGEVQAARAVFELLEARYRR